MTEARVWTPPPKLDDLFTHLKGNQFANVNSSTSGARSQKELPVGNAKLQFYSLATPNGHKPAIYLEELGVDYDAHTINIGASALDQFTSGFVEINPNSKIPALVDLDGFDGEKTPVFESAAIVYYLAEKFDVEGKFYPQSPKLRNEIRQWIFWQMGGQGPHTGNFGHFFVYAPADQIEARNYGVARYGMEVKRLCHVLETRLTGRTYLVGEKYSIADIVVFPWFYQLSKGYLQKNGEGAASFLSVLEDYPNSTQWMNRILERPAVQRGLQVCSSAGAKPWLENKL